MSFTQPSTLSQEPTQKLHLLEQERTELDDSDEEERELKFTFEELNAKSDRVMDTQSQFAATELIVSNYSEEVIKEGEEELENYNNNEEEEMKENNNSSYVSTPNDSVMNGNSIKKKNIYAIPVPPAFGGKNNGIAYSRTIGNGF